jgi:hypothetical protein
MKNDLLGDSSQRQVSACQRSGFDIRCRHGCGYRPPRHYG